MEKKSWGYSRIQDIYTQEQDEARAIMEELSC